MKLNFLRCCVAILLFSVILAGCAPKDKATTAREFVKIYSKAWKKGDVETIYKMQVKDIFLKKMRLNAALKKQIAKYKERNLKEEITADIKNKDSGYQAWSSTYYIRESDCGDHIHADVAVKGEPTRTVLVREADSLKLHPNPSWFMGSVCKK